MANRENKLTVIELNGQLLKGAIEVKKVLKKYVKIPPLKELHVTVTYSEERETSGSLALLVGLKNANKSEYSLTKTYPFGIADSDSSVVAFKQDSRHLLNDFGIDPEFVAPTTAAHDDHIDALFDIEPKEMENAFGEFWSLQTANLSFQFASNLVRFVYEVYESSKDVEGVEIKPFEYEETFAVTKSSEFSFSLEFFGLDVGGSDSKTSSLTHKFKVKFG